MKIKILTKKVTKNIKYFLCLSLIATPFAKANANPVITDVAYSDVQLSESSFSQTIIGKLQTLKCKTTVGDCKAEIKSLFTAAELTELIEKSHSAMSHQPQAIQTSVSNLEKSLDDNAPIETATDPLNILFNSTACSQCLIFIAIGSLLVSILIPAFSHKENPIEKCEKEVKQELNYKLKKSKNNYDPIILEGVKKIGSQLLQCKCHNSDKDCRELINKGVIK